MSDTFATLVVCQNRRDTSSAREFDTATLTIQQWAMLVRHWDEALTENRALQFMLDNPERQERE